MHSGKEYAIGDTVTMSEKNAADLIVMNVISPADEVAPSESAPQAPANPEAPVAPVPTDPEAGSEENQTQALGGQQTVNGSEKTA